jgi:hypothetical protein
VVVITRVGLVDELTPAVAAWIKDLNPAAGRALLKAGRVIRRAALVNVRGMFNRTGRRRTEPTAQRGLRLRMDQAAGLRTVRVWHGSGILAAHELGSTIPPITLRPVSRRALAWGGTADRRERFARVIHRRGFTLRKRRTLEPAYLANASAVLDLLEEEYEKVLALAPPALRT